VVISLATVKQDMFVTCNPIHQALNFLAVRYTTKRTNKHFIIALVSLVHRVTTAPKEQVCLCRAHPALIVKIFVATIGRIVLIVLQGFIVEKALRIQWSVRQDPIVPWGPLIQRLVLKALIRICLVYKQ
jgi:hypothetical protein